MSMRLISWFKISKRSSSKLVAFRLLMSSAVICGLSNLLVLLLKNSSCDWNIEALVTSWELPLLGLAFPLFFSDSVVLGA